MKAASAVESDADSSRRPIELLAPAGDRECARAAVENGADAIYFGLASSTAFNARARAKNIPVEELPELMDQLHARGVRGYVTLNTLIFPNELEQVETLLRHIAVSGADAVLVQDLGAARLAREVCPELPVHASTQMTVTSAEHLRWLAPLGFERVILARELSIAEIAAIRKETDVELEAFVHGALCVSYSGQCLASRALGGRSANRGECAQACRMPYQFVCDERTCDLGDRKYLLSPQDLAAFDRVPELIAAGVTALKIEGRLKTPEYVAHVTRHYRRAIDAAVAGTSPNFTREEVQDLEVSFSRGFSHGWLDGPKPKTLVPGVSSSNRGVALGEIVGFFRDRVKVRLACAVERGDGVVFEGDRAAGGEQGGRVFEIFEDRRPVRRAEAGVVVELAFRRDSLDFNALRAGQTLRKTDDPRLERRLRQSFSGPQSQRRTAIDVVVEAGVGRPLVVEAVAETGAACRVESPQPLEAARKHALAEPVLREQLGRLGETPFVLRGLDVRIDGSPMAPLSVLGAMRHEMVRQLESSLVVNRPRRTPVEPSPLPRLRAEAAAVPETDSGVVPSRSLALHVLCRTMDQFREMLHADVQSVIVDFREVRACREAVEAARHARMPITIASPRITVPGEMGALRELIACGPDAILARNPAAISAAREAGLPVIADFSLNTANELTARRLFDGGAARVVPSYDMESAQILDLVEASRPERIEVVVHQHVPMFHMRHCVFRSVLSPGDEVACGRPCDRHEVRLRDRLGVEHPATADVGCCNTVFHGSLQSGLDLLPTLLARGVRHFRIEFIATDGDRPERIVSIYREAAAGRLAGPEAWKRLRAVCPSGVRGIGELVTRS